MVPEKIDKNEENTNKEHSVGTGERGWFKGGHSKVSERKRGNFEQYERWKGIRSCRYGGVQELSQQLQHRDKPSETCRKTWTYHQVLYEQSTGIDK